MLGELFICFLVTFLLPNMEWLRLIYHCDNGIKHITVRAPTDDPVIVIQNQ